MCENHQTYNTERKNTSEGDKALNSFPDIFNLDYKTALFVSIVNLILSLVLKDYNMLPVLPKVVIPIREIR